MTDPTVPEELQRTLPDTLVLQRELGGGGMSRVYLARDSALGRDVVVKVLSPQLAGELSAERFTREIRVAATLQQANIVPLLTAGVAGDTPYFTMPYVDGESLRHRLREGERLSVNEAVDILRDVARALSYAHARGIVHRDIKPENILLSHGAAVVTDFGIAKAVSASRTMEYAAADDPSTLTRAGMSVGTPMYMAPEQITGSDAVDHRADIYAWGCLAYELVTGAPPFVRDHVSRVLVAHISEAPRPLTEVAPSVPASLAKIVMQCLAKEAADRPSHMQDVISALASTGEVTPPSSATRRSVPRAGIVAAVLITAILAGVWWRTTAVSASKSSAPGGTADASPSLAVIPFVSVGGDTANVYLADGIADELTTVLSRVPGLRLAGRSTAARFKGSTLTARELGDTLDVRTILLGSLRRAGDRVRVTAELSDAGDGRVLWQNTFEEDARDVFRMQEQLAQAIAGQLQLRLSATATSVGTTNPDAYDYYLRGMQVYRNRGPVYTDAEKYFDEAIKRDSNFARAWAGKAIAVNGSPYYVLINSRQTIPIAVAAAQRALALDSLSPDVHIALASTAYEKMDWATAEREADRAVALDSLSAVAHWRRGFNLLNQGKVAEALPALKRAQELDPLQATAVFYLGYARTLAGQTDEGIRDAIRGHELSPNLVSGQSIVLLTLMAANQYARAATLAERFAKGTDDPMRTGAIAMALRRGGKPELAAPIEGRLEAAPDGLRGVWSGRLTARLGRNDIDGAIEALERAGAGDGDLIPSTVLASPIFDPLRAHPRFRAAIARFHLENTPAATGLPARRP